MKRNIFYATLYVVLLSSCYSSRNIACKGNKQMMNSGGYSKRFKF